MKSRSHQGSAVERALRISRLRLTIALPDGSTIEPRYDYANVLPPSDVA
jgi:hypothetical protein